MDRRVLMCLLGPAGSGKSTLAGRLEQLRPELVARVPVDFFFRPRAVGESLTAYFDRPFAYDWTHLDRALVADGSRRTTPDCDFTLFRWRAGHGGLPIGRAPVYALDGMRPHPRAELVVRLDIDGPTQIGRLRDRDMRWGSSVADRAEHLRRTNQAGSAELTRTPDLILSATDPVDDNAIRVLELLRSAYR